MSKKADATKKVRARGKKSPAAILSALQIHKDLQSQFLAKGRDVIIYLPPDYHQNSARRYPVFYMHDGQNLFDPNTSYIKGNYWRVGETAQALILSGQIEPLIIVGIYNAGEQRINEYTPTYDDKHKVGGQIDQYGRMLVEELKPFIDSQYRTLPAGEHTAMGGSSLGGLATLYLGFKYPQVFSRLAVLSPSIWWGNGAIVGIAQSLPGKLPLRIWLDMGTREGRWGIASARLLRNALKEKGWSTRSDLKYFEARGAQHTESEWAKRVEPLLKFLFPPNGARRRKRSMV
jgi:predicted alpha/beta superfamily hydrolase